MTEKVEQKNVPTDVVLESELHGVTPDMIDWWWVNIEKGYPLWEPEEHKSCVWEVPPGKDTHVGAIHIVEESLGFGPVMKMRLRFEDLNTCPIPIDMEHAILVAGLMPPDDKIIGYVLHQYESASYGTRIRSTSRLMLPLPPEANEGWKKHAGSEMKRFSQFLPEFYKLWQVVKDSEINRQCSLKRK